ncbi:serine hydrolase domain-containing protein [Nocardia goodfellowii]|uniref:D-alanyl-D-alanine carboxypeptidase n=1 Tax=Nocardia goodfellowii TaxID=882446 RepID=A0ABS4QB79_9NOCA|nr:serine hydrolase domain-containing protein [Nocardia goodfellowii]MBP2188334.1 D-alanyl-D-alanine carboxypeptidase [Nocardia goodfellowii]
MTTTLTTQDPSLLQQTIDELVGTGFTGLSLRVNDEHGEWVGSAGIAELGTTAVPPVDGHIRIGSNTKTFIATVVLQLAGENKIDLDAAVVDYLPEFDLDPRITVRMLLQHTSGVFNFTGEVFEDGSVAPGIDWSGQAWVDNRFKTYRPQELVEFALSKPARFEPGTDWSYANTNYVLAKLVVEKVTGRTLGQEMDRLILGPLGLSGTVVPETSTEIPEPHAHAYYRYEDAAGAQQIADVTNQNPSWISGGGDMISTTADLHTFITALVTGKLVPSALLEQMFTPHSKIPYGLGVFVQESASGTVITHNGGHGGHGALMYATADGRKTLTATLNYIDDADLSLSAEFQAATQRLVNDLFGAPPQ